MMLQKLLFIFTVAIPGLAVSISVPAQESFPQAVDYDVKLLPEAAAPNPNISVIRGHKCKDDKHGKDHPGCMLFRSDTTGVIRFYLPGKRHKMGCSEKSVKRVITAIELSTTPLDDDKTKGNFDVDYDSWLKESAFKAVDGNGFVFGPFETEDGRTSVVLLNENSYPYESNKVKSFYYRVTVTNCDEKDETPPWTTDPRGDNEGLN